MSIKLNGSNSGSVEIDVPADAGLNTAITFPATSGEVIVSDTSGDVDLGPLTIDGAASDGSVNLDSSGRLLVGTSTALTGAVTRYSKLVVQGNSGIATGPAFLSAARGETAATIASADQTIGRIDFTDSGAGQFATISCITDAAVGLNDYPSRLVFSTAADGASSPTERMRISRGGKLTVPGVYASTTTGGSAVYVESDGDLLRYTSSIKYKTDIEALEDTRADAILNCRPVWYRSKCDNDIKTKGAEKSDWGWYGFIAEEVAEIDPRLVNWATKDAVVQEDGSVQSVERDPADYEAEGVRYDNFVPLLLNLVKRQKEQIQAQGTAIAALEARLTALEGGAS